MDRSIKETSHEVAAGNTAETKAPTALAPGSIFPNAQEPTAGPTLDGVRRAALTIATRRGEELRRIKEQLVAGQEAEALRLLYNFFGLLPTSIAGGGGQRDR
jgi:hypothetical protein